MTPIIRLPRLEVLDRESLVAIDGELAPLDQAVIIVDGREEDTITIDRENAGALAAQLVRFVNHHREIIGALQAAANALRALEHGAAAGPATTIIAGACELLIEQTGAAA